MTIDALTLALDGVIFDTEEAHLAACNAAFDTCGIGLRWSIQQFRQAARAHGANHAINAMSSILCVKEAALLLQEKHGLFHDIVLSTLPERHPGCTELMNDALARGCKLAVVTDMPTRTATELLQRVFGDAVTNTFTVVVSGASFDEPGDNGPHQLALRTIGIDADHCAAIDAAAPGLRAAQHAGIWTMAATPYEKDIARISGADLWCPQLQELRDLIGKRTPPGDKLKRYVSFDALRSFKMTQMTERPVLRQAMQFRQSA